MKLNGCLFICFYFILNVNKESFWEWLLGVFVYGWLVGISYLYCNGIILLKNFWYCLFCKGGDWGERNVLV